MSGQAAALAFDLGAGSGRAIVGRLDKQQERLTVEEIHRFSNDPVKAGNYLHWDILRLLHEIKQGILKSKHLEIELESMGIDSWAVDFGLLSRSGELLGNPYHYRDHQTDGIMEEVAGRVGKNEIFARTGLQFLPFNTIYQLYALKKRSSPLLEKAAALLMIPDLLRYFLTGEMITEYTNATTTQLWNPTTGSWDTELMERLDLSVNLLLPPVAAGSKAGSLSKDVSQELGIDSIPIIAVGEHDTASAVAAVPATEEKFAYLISGTWSLMGTELSSPVLNDQALAWNFTNEGGVYGTNRLLKNIMGLWLIQECKRTWDKEGKDLSFEKLVELAKEADPFQSFIDPDHPSFLNPDHMPDQIRQFCRDTGQYVPQTEGEIARIIFESLALKYRTILEQIEQLSAHSFKNLYMVGGGIQNQLLCQFTANAVRREVLAGPVEASALGNLVVQYISLGHIADLKQARRIIRTSFPARIYRPVDTEIWLKAYEAFQRIITL
ncbi:rhamnulokinase [Paenibacillaceae bacterium T2]|uniref:Rhamnulokinase n=1 Tax=Ferviditalea candida TaxID=3108399 RepID=A0ABU5ZM36_9BACL|nr:rhamnulokinase [Paenibacillaceae bacterium T2]